MMHRQRTWGQPAAAESPEHLARVLTEQTWTSCSAWRLGRLLFLNDATCEDGAQEYAVLRPVDTCACPSCPCGTGHRACRCPSPYYPLPLCTLYEQVESITFSWCTYEEALQYLRQLQAGDLGGEPYGAPWAVRFHPKGEACHLCR